MTSLRDELCAGLKALNLVLSEDKIDALMAYHEAFVKWNRAYNLSAIRDPREMIYKHLLDSLSIVSFLEKHSAKRIIDVGTGGGLPGIPLAICFPDRHFALLDSAGKKTRFLLQTAHALGLKNIEVLNKRVEEHQPEDRFDIVMSRAFASIGDMLQWCSHLGGDQSEFWAMKGVNPADELSGLAKHYKVENCYPLQVPGDIGERCLVVITAGSEP